MTEKNKWIKWARELQALSQTGLHFTDNEYDIERYRKIGEIAAEMLSERSTLSKEDILTWQRAEFGYATPKVDVRGVVFREDRILLVREIADNNRWTLPGGWADVNESPSEAVVREVHEESGFEVKVKKLLAVYDREKQGHVPPMPYHIYKINFLCEILGGSAKTSNETSEVGFFAENNLPELALSRVTPKQLEVFFRIRKQSCIEAEFD